MRAWLLLVPPAQSAAVEEEVAQLLVDEQQLRGRLNLAAAQRPPSSWRLDAVIVALTLRRLVRLDGITGVGGANRSFPHPGVAPPGR